MEACCVLTHCPAGDGQAEGFVPLLTELLYRHGIPRSGSRQASRQISLFRLFGTTVGCARPQNYRTSLMRVILSFMYAIWLMTGECDRTSTVYSAMGISYKLAVNALDKSPSIAVRSAASTAVQLWWLQFALNMSWSTLFFGMHKVCADAPRGYITLRTAY